MTKEESRAIAFVGVLLCLATVARLLNRPEPIAITSAPVDVAALRAAGEALAQGRTPATERSRVASARPRPTSGPLDINRATAVQLEALPGIGPAVARRIIAYRDSVGRFSSVEQLDSVKGIGPALLAKVAPLVVVR